MAQPAHPSSRLTNKLIVVLLAANTALLALLLLRNPTQPQPPRVTVSTADRPEQASASRAEPDRPLRGRLPATNAPSVTGGTASPPSPASESVPLEVSIPPIEPAVVPSQPPPVLTPARPDTVVLVPVAPVVRIREVAGRVVLNGSPPEDRRLPVDPACGYSPSETPTTQAYRVGPGGELADVVVYIDLAPSPRDRSSDQELPKLTIDVARCLFSPKIIAFQTGQPITVVNRDAIIHNISMEGPRIPLGMATNRALLPGKSRSLGPYTNLVDMIPVRCMIHPWMYAYLSSFDHPYFQVTGTNGLFRIPDVPAGTHTLVARHRKLGWLKSSILVDPAAPEGEIDFTFSIPEPSANGGGVSAR